ECPHCSSRGHRQEAFCGIQSRSAMKFRTASVAALILFSSSLFAQWPKFKQSGVPRDAEGRVVMDAKVPRTADGKPDLSGVWTRADRGGLPQELAGVVAPRGQTNRSGGVVVEPPTTPFAADPNAPPLATFFDLGTNMPGGLPFTPAAAEVKKQRMATNDKDNPDANCLPMGITQF